MTVLAEVLQPLAEMIPSSLVSPATLATIGATVCALPSTLTYHFGFECALGDPTPSADFACVITAHDGGHHVLATEPLPAAYLAHPVWARLRQFAALWTEPGSSLYEGLRNVWLEFDLREASAGAVPVPSVFVAPRDGLTAPPAPEPTLSEPWLLDPALRLLRGEPLPSATVRAVTTCVAALPPDAHVFQAGLMLARPGDAVRLCVRGVPLTEVTAYLARAGWPGDPAAAHAALAPYAALATETALHLDVGSAVSPRLGLECYLGVFGGGDWSATAPAFLDRLSAEGLCVPSKRAGLLAWPGDSRVPPERVALPPQAAATALLLGREGSTRYRRNVNHVKLSYTPGRPLEAKTYVSVVLSWPLRKTGAAPRLGPVEG